MNWALNLGRIAGIKLRIHWTFIFLILWVIFINRGQNTAFILTSIGFVLAVFGCVVLHEFGHALMAKKYDIKTRDITLLPIGGVARIENMPEQPKQELWIALAGPLVNVIIAGILFIIIRASSAEVELSSRISQNNFLFQLLAVNLMLVIFNLIPAFPMDGGRIFRALLSFSMSRTKATRIASSVGQFIAVLFIFLGFFFNPFLIFIGVFVYLGAQMEAEHTQTQSVLANFRVRDVMMTKAPILQEHDSLEKSIEMLLSGQDKAFLVLNSDNSVVGMLTQNDIIHGLTEKGKNITVGEIMQRNFEILSPDMFVNEVYSIMRQKAYVLLPVILNGQLIGALDLENILEFVIIRNALQKYNENNPFEYRKVA